MRVRHCTRTVSGTRLLGWRAGDQGSAGSSPGALGASDDDAKCALRVPAAASRGTARSSGCRWSVYEPVQQHSGAKLPASEYWPEQLDTEQHLLAGASSCPHPGAGQTAHPQLTLVLPLSSSIPPAIRTDTVGPYPLVSGRAGASRARWPGSAHGAR
eukprot:341777-Rhodomonas_salina.2